MPRNETWTTSPLYTSSQNYLIWFAMMTSLKILPHLVRHDNEDSNCRVSRWLTVHMMPNCAKESRNKEMNALFERGPYAYGPPAPTSRLQHLERLVQSHCEDHFCRWNRSRQHEPHQSLGSRRHARR